MKTISVSGSVALLDEDDFDRISKFKWYLYGRGYAGRCELDRPKKEGGVNRIHYLHRVIMNAKKGEVVDHINGDRLDNRKCNLRFCDYSTNAANQSVGARKTLQSTSKFKGVTWAKDRNKWEAKIQCDRRHRNLGRFDSEIDAARAYDQMAKALFGRFAKTNFV